jgi:hypothetical protein
LGGVVYVLNQWSFSQLTFGILAVFCVWLVATLSALCHGQFKLSGFASWSDFGAGTLGTLV